VWDCDRVTRVRSQFQKGRLFLRMLFPETFGDFTSRQGEWTRVKPGETIMIMHLSRAVNKI
jgi:hypothetical protein